MGKAVTIAGKPVDTCASFYLKDSAIHVESDSAAASYGVLIVSLTEPPQTAVMLTRDGTSIPVPIDLVPVALRTDKTLAQYLFRAGFRNGKVDSLKPFLYVPASTMVKPFGKMQFTGAVKNMTPTDGIAPSAWMRWNFSKLDAEQKMQGTFANLNSAIRSGPLLKPVAPCQAPLNHGVVPTAWYSRTLGTTQGLSLYWEPAMHRPLDSELVVVMGSGVSYMTSTPSINVLIKNKFDTGREYTFSIHGNPMGTPYQFTGLFAAQTPVRSCKFQ